jgi:NADPH:quinone reductase
MRAVLVEKYDSIENIQIGEVKLPDIMAGQVLVKVQAASVGFVEGLKVRGLYQTKDPLPFTPGKEFSGIVETVADKVEGLVPGMRVMGNVANGALAEYVAADASDVYLMPESVSPEVGASFYVSYMTALLVGLLVPALRPAELFFSRWRQLALQLPSKTGLRKRSFAH